MVNTGDLDVSSAVGQGGTVQVTGDQVDLVGGLIDASGLTGGGFVETSGIR